MDKKGFTLIEMILLILILGIALTITMPSTMGIYDKFLLETAANEVQSALYLAQQISIDESKSYCFELIQDGFRIREDILLGKVIYVGKINHRIQIIEGYQSRTVFNRHGETGYGLYILRNQKGQEVRIEVMIGTGMVRRTNAY